MFDLLNNKPIWNLYEWYIETNNIQGQKYFLVGVSDQYEKGRPIRSSICNKIDFENIADYNEFPNKTYFVYMKN